MVEPADREFLRSIFLMEAWETVAALEAGVVDAGLGNAEALHVVTHRLKGAASLHGFPAVAAIAAELETLLESTPFDAARLATLLAELKRALDARADGTSDAPIVEPAPPVAGEAGDGVELVLDDPVRRELAAFFASNADVASYFVPEATEHLEAMTTALLALERGGGDEDLARLFRSMHTIKGAAYVVGCVRVGELAHRAEDLLVAVREGDATLSPPALEALFVTVDVLKLMLGLTSNPAASITAVAADVRGRLEALLIAPSAASAVTDAPAAPAPPVAPIAALPESPAPTVAPTPPAPPRRALPSSAAARRAPRQTIRVNLERLDALMDLIGELVTGRSRIDRRLEELERLSASPFASLSRLSEAVTELERRQLEPRGATPAPHAKPEKPARPGE